MSNKTLVMRGSAREFNGFSAVDVVDLHAGCATRSTSVFSLSHKARLLSLCGCLLPLSAQAGFFQDSHLTMEARNFYLNRDFRDSDKSDVPRFKGQPKNKLEDWGQGFIMRYESGFTPGPIGFGVDGMGLLGIKLDSGAGTSGSGALPRNPITGEVPDEFSFFGWTGKAKVSQSTLTVGTHLPTLPVVYYNDTRMLPQTFFGAQLLSKDIRNMTVLGGQFRKTRLRDSTNYEDMTMFSDRATGGMPSDHFNYGGLTYTWSPKLSASYFYGELENNYKQHYIGLLSTLPLTESLKFKSDLRYFISDDDGRSTVDNRTAQAMLTLLYRGHALGGGYVWQTGDTGMPFIAGGTNAYTINLATYHHFLRAHEDSWQVRYDYDFAPLGLPGLTFMARYMRGSDFQIGNQNANEWERDVDISYVVQSGLLKDLNLRWRNLSYRSSNTTDLDENRLIVSYTFKFW